LHPDVESRRARTGSLTHATSRFAAADGLLTASSKGWYFLSADFAALLDPALVDRPLLDAIAEWQKNNLNPFAKKRAARRRDPALSASAVGVTLSNGQTRPLHPGPSSDILKAFIEQFVPRLVSPEVLFISQSGQTVDLIEEKSLRAIGLTVDQQQLLPDCLVADLDEQHQALWFIEVVATDGPITEARKTALLAWAAPAGVSRDQCRFVTIFASRTSSEAKKCLPRIALGSSSWYSDEPDSLLTCDPINTQITN
jgi:hypothetical protein